jgi:hypothetical protein
MQTRLAYLAKAIMNQQLIASQDTIIATYESTPTGPVLRINVDVARVSLLPVPARYTACSTQPLTEDCHAHRYFER